MKLQMAYSKWHMVLALFLYIFSIIALFFYSFTQIDLSLTITRTSFFQPVQRAFQGVGYFNRPLSTELYIGIIVMLFLSYILLFRLAKQNVLQRKTIWMLIFFASGLLLFSYNAFSYDLFNYIFDAKIITHYNENPYLKKALDFPADPMLSFMRWTHRVYPYGPTWLVFTVPLSFLGLNYFVVTFFLFKAAIISSFIGTSYYIEKIAEKIVSHTGKTALVFFALNPLVIIESLVSAHNDVVMLFFAMFSLWLLLQSRVVLSSLLLLFSIGIKFATGLLVPVYLYLFVRQRSGKSIDFEKVSLVLFGVMVLAMILATVRTNFQPWYFLYALPFAALLIRKTYVVIGAMLFSFGALFQYVPFLFLGNYDPPVPAILQAMWFTSFVVSILSAGFFLLRKSR